MFENKNYYELSYGTNYYLMYLESFFILINFFNMAVLKHCRARQI